MKQTYFSLLFLLITTKIPADYLWNKQKKIQKEGREEDQLGNLEPKKWCDGEFPGFCFCSFILYLELGEPITRKWQWTQTTAGPTALLGKCQRRKGGGTFITTGGNGQLPSCGVSGDGKASNTEMPTITVKKFPTKAVCPKNQVRGYLSKQETFRK